MEDVTDCAFREMFAKYSNPHPSPLPEGEGKKTGNSFVMFTEFVSTDGLMHPEGRKKLSIDLKYTEIQRPIMAQIWGRDPEKFYRVAEYLAELGFDGIDINMGCPQSKEIQAGACAALIREPKLAQEIIRATQKGAGNLPVSVKTRIGYSSTDEMEEWLKHLLEMELPAVTLHARTKKEMSKVPAHWDKIKEAVEIRNREGSKTLIIGNGDVKSLSDAYQKVDEAGCDGIMIGRGAFGNPWLFKGIGGRNPEGVSSSIVAPPLAGGGAPASSFQGFSSREVNSTTTEHINSPTTSPLRGPLLLDPTSHEASSDLRKEENTAVTPKERLRVMLEHAELFDRMFSGIKSFTIMRKHFKAYCSGFDGASELRAKLMETKSLEETKVIVNEYLNNAK
jgi:tRNA-dihydrouridine synthase